jgi:hypothetical protein
VFTFVIALGDASSLFDPVAAAGGTNSAFAITGGNVRRAVADALAIIAGVRVPCTFDITQVVPAGITFDPSLVSVAFDIPNRDPSPVTRVQNAADCANHDRDGWYFDGAAKQVVICPDLCNLPRAHLLYQYDCRPLARVADGGGTQCGDGVCSHSEDQFSCPNDCGGTCGDGVCGRNEDAFSCSPDCFCSNHTCDTDETAQSCPVDCACGAAEKFCNGTCVLRKPANGCNSLTCDPCTTVPPPNGVATCDQNGACGFSCLSGFRKSGDRCVSIFGDAAAD